MHHPLQERREGFASIGDHLFDGAARLPALSRRVLALLDVLESLIQQAMQRLTGREG
jgi:hypothetical protein